MDERRHSADAQAWGAGAVERGDTWWQDWTAWIAERAGERGAPPPLGGVDFRRSPTRPARTSTSLDAALDGAGPVR
jgi:poly(3-hydroxyalkanoate) synthetase